LGCSIAYIDCGQLSTAKEALPCAVGAALSLPHAPYSSFNPWFEVLDDLGFLDEKLPGLVLVLDRAYDLLKRAPKYICRIIEIFERDSDSWLAMRKPHHLYLQMEDDPRVKEWFDPHPTARS
jgi:hypothetical protein